jgi:hypothetical protein
MKKIIAFAILLVITINSFCQKLTSDQYLKKSKNQKTAAWVLLGGGAALFITGLAIPRGEELWDDIWGIPTVGHKNDGVKGALYLTGTLSMLGSIPLFIASGRNKGKAVAASANFQMQKRPVMQVASVVNRLYPAVSIRIGL